MNRAKIGAVVVAVLLAVYLFFTVQRGWFMIIEDDPIARLLGISLLLLPAVGAWALCVELLFGSRMQRLARMLDAEGGLPADDLPRTPGGRIIREAADQRFHEVRAHLEEDSGDWRRWFSLSMAYDAAGDRRRARHAMRRAIALERSPESASS